MEVTEQSQTSLPRRYNGRLAACDACRTRKVACDHTRPICNRCRRRARGSECVYSEPEPRRQSSRLTRRAPGTSLLPQNEISEGDAQENVHSIESPNLSASSKPTRSRGYLGATSYGAIFEEARNSLSLLSVPDLDLVGDESGATESHLASLDLTPPLREMSFYVLRCLACHLSEQGESDDASLCANNGWADAATSRIIIALQTMFAQTQDQGEDGLISIAEKITHNTTRPLQDNVPTPNEWLDQFCGANLRWESVGLLWASLQHVSDVLHSISCRRFDWLSSRYSPRTARTCLDYCISLSRHFAEPNILLLDICRRNSTLESTIYGEARLPTYMSFGLAVTTMHFLGLHAQQYDTSYTPTLFSENRRRLFAQIFTSDKIGVSFSGRPPLLSRRFCSTPLPLDLRDEDLASDPGTLRRAFESLDQQGWNTENKLYPATIIRARAIIAFIRDELVEIALSHNGSVTLDHLSDIKSRQHAAFSQFPKSIIYHPEELTKPGHDMRQTYVKILVHIEHLKNIFFVERLQVLYGQPNQGDIIATSFTMLERVLLFWTHREMFPFPSMDRNFEWLVLAYGAPAAGILCLALLQPTFPILQSKDTNVSRSSIIQQLSLLVSLLDWVKPSAPNRDLCLDCKAVVQRVLDHHLNSSLNMVNATTAPIDWGVMSIPDFNFELMDTFEWARSDAQ